MKLGLEQGLYQTQQLVMSLRMQQAIRILQCSSLELREEIEKEYLENPTLEIEEGGGADSVADVPAEASDEKSDKLSEWLQYLEGDTPYRGGRASSEVHEPVFAAPVDISLEKELLEQAYFTFPEKTKYKEREIAVFIIGSLDRAGYLMTPIDEIAQTLDATTEKVEAVLSIIQTFEPVGVGARTLSECLRLQAEEQDVYQGLVAQIIDHHLEALANSQIRQIASVEHTKPANVQLAVDIIRKMNPRPGSAYGGERADYVIPDVILKKEGEEYHITFNDPHVPKICISPLYRKVDTIDEAARKHIKERLEAATYLIDSIERRKATILKVVQAIVQEQGEAIEHGWEYLHPLTMRDVAESIDMHESTVSRAMANKYIELPRWGVVPLRKFFVARLAAMDGGEDYAADQAKKVIAKLIGGEDKKKPLSDQAICDKMKERNIDISRRTVMKYREQLGYPSSVRRKRY